MRISTIVVENIKGVRHFELRPGTLTILRGSNGVGKSSLLDAITCPFEGGCDPNWLHGWPENPVKEGHVAMEIVDDDGQLVATIVKTIRLSEDGAVKATLEIIDPNGVAVPGPKTFLDGLGDSWAVDPAAILKVDTSKAEGRKQLMAKLLDVMVIEFGRDELAVALGGLTIPGLNIARGCGLDGVAKAKEYVTEMRKGIGRDRDEASGAAATLRKNLPNEEEAAVDWVARARELEQERLTLTARESREREEVTRAGTVEREGIAADFAAEEQGLREEFQRKLSELAERKQAKLSGLYNTEASALERIRIALKPDFERISTEQATAREKADQQQKAQGVRDSLKTFEQKERAKAREYDALTATLGRLESLKRAKLSELPIPGLSFENGQVYVNGVVWDHVNTAKKFTIAMQLASMRAGKLRFMVAEDAEHFDPETWAEVSQALGGAGFQLVAAVAEKGPLTVEAA